MEEGLAGAVRVLEEIVAGRRAVRAVRHPLGFLCLPVLREEEHGVCVHIFGGGGEAAGLTTSPYHAHSWDLTSSVLYGEVGNVRVRVREESREPTHRVFEVHSSPSGVDVLRPTSRLVRWESDARQTTGRGSTYTLAAGEFHATVVPTRRAAATLVHGRTLPGRTDLSLGPVDGTAHRGVRQVCNAEETARLARSALRKLHESDNGD